MIGFQLLPKSRLDCSVIMEKTSYHVFISCPWSPRICSLTTSFSIHSADQVNKCTLI